MRVLIVVVIALAAGFAMGQARPGPPAVLEAEGFVLRDSRGHTRAHLTLIAAGSVTLGLANQSGDTRVALVVGVNGAPQLTLQDVTGKTRIIIGMLPVGWEFGYRMRPERVVWSTP